MRALLLTMRLASATRVDPSALVPPETDNDPLCTSTVPVLRSGTSNPTPRDRKSTSELQSHSDFVCRLTPVKKKLRPSWTVQVPLLAITAPLLRLRSP